MVMENHLVVLLLSLFVLICAFYGYTVEQKIFQIKNDLLQHEKEKKEVKEVKVDLESTIQDLKQLKVELESMHKELTEVKVDLETTRKEHKQVKVELETMTQEIAQVKVELELTSNAVKQVKVELDTTRNELKQVKIELDTTRNELKQVKVEMDATKEQINLLRKETLEKDNARKKEINQIRADVNVLPGELNKIKTELQTQRPGFYVTLTSEPTLSPSQRIQFDKIITDVGNNYDKISDVFTAPKDGLYHFSFTMFSKTGALHAEIMQNNQVRGRNYGTSSGVSATINVVISCKKGDSVFVRHETGRGVQNIHGYGYTAFSGFLIN